MPSANNKRIIKNTGMLYFRMLLTMCITLYTSRVVLNTLGVDDYGIYNVVGGIVTMFAFLNTSMASATQRFYSFELGQQNYIQLTNIFSLTLSLHILIALIIFLLAETVGLWFFNTQMNIPESRMEAAFWVYQFAVLSFMISVIQVPYNASIIAHETMGVYAWVSIIEVSLKLIIVFILVGVNYDKLKLYALLMFLVTLIITTIYGIYCKIKYIECSYKWFWDKKLYHTLLSYAGWNLFGGVSAVSMNQGINILLNIFFGPVVNAARAIAFQVNMAINSFVQNFQLAVNPQIIKSYASGDYAYMRQLVFQSSKYSFFLLIFLSLPVLAETDTILKLWLKVIPEYTVIFCQLVIINTWIDSVSGPLMTSAQASGRIKIYQLVIGSLLLLNLPISYLFIKLGFQPQVTILVSMVISVVALFARLWMLKILLEFPVLNYVRQVLGTVFLVAIMGVILPFCVKEFMSQGYLRLFLVCVTSVFSVSLAIYLIGLNNAERVFFKNKVVEIFHKINFLC